MATGWTMRKRDPAELCPNDTRPIETIFIRATLVLLDSHSLYAVGIEGEAG
jgi:hypothetical protein